MKKMLTSGVFVFAGMVTIPSTVTNTEAPKPVYEGDPRLETLQRFFDNRDCPAKEYTELFLKASDDYNLDWRLLPSLSVVESGGGREARNNNLFGWDNGDAEFKSVAEGIHTVAQSLGTSRLYRDKRLDEVLRTYNPNENYPGVVKSVMRRIAPNAILN